MEGLGRDDPAQWNRLGLLADPVRRAAYDLFWGTRELTREQVADRVGISPALAGHHLGKLVSAELLDKRPGVAAGREGRPPSTYRCGAAPRLPGRRSETLINVLSGAAQPDMLRVRAAARIQGQSATPRSGSRRSRAERALAALGFAPSTAGGVLNCGGCPFVARDLALPLVACEVALSLTEGIADEVAPATAERVTGGACCVRLVLERRENKVPRV